MNLKYNYLFKKLLKWANKKCKNFNTYNVASLKKKKNTWRYNYFAPVYHTFLWYDLQFLRYRVWQTKISNYGSFFGLLPPPPPSLKTKKIRTLINKCLEISFYTCVPRMTIVIKMLDSWDMEPDRHNFLSILDYFLPFYPPIHPPLTTLKTTFWKHEKNAWR